VREIAANFSIGKGTVRGRILKFPMNDAANELYPLAGIDCRDPLVWNIEPAERGRYVLPSHVISTEIDNERGYGDVSPH
jgi:hypothetical protein